jgi:hypothetical protein
LKEAIELNAFEEARHKHVLSNLVAAYGIVLAPEPQYVTHSECIDSFFAFGLFEAAKRSGFYPESLVDTFEPVIQEEGRHIIFFADWVAWHRRTMPGWRRFFSKSRCFASRHSSSGSGSALPATWEPGCRTIILR